MFTIPSQISISNFNISTFGIFVLLGFLLFAYVVWKEGRGDGFDEERLFDLLLISSVVGILLSRAVFAFYTSRDSSQFFGHIFRIWQPGMNVYGGLAGFLIPLSVLCKKWKWSIYRILDIFSLGLCLALSVVLLAYVGLQARFEFLFAFAFLIILFALLSKIRTQKVKSGYVSCLFMLGLSLVGIVFFQGRDHLIFYLVLATISLVVFLFRWRLSNYETSGVVRSIVGRIKTRISKQKDSA